MPPRVGRHDDGHTYEKGDKRSRIDHWLAGHNVADRMQPYGYEHRVSDHWGVAVSYGLQVRGEGNGWGPERAKATPMDKLTEEDWEAYQEASDKACRKALDALSAEGRNIHARRARGSTYNRRLRPLGRGQATQRT